MSAFCSYQGLECWQTEWCMKNEWIVWIKLFIECAVGDVAPASMCLHCCWRQTFRAYDVETVWLTMLLHVWRFLRQLLSVTFVAVQWVIKSTVFTAQSVTSNFLRDILGKVGTFCTVFMCLFHDMSTNCYWLSQSKKYVSTFLRHGTVYSLHNAIDDQHWWVNASPGSLPLYLYMLLWFVWQIISLAFSVVYICITDKSYCDYDYHDYPQMVACLEGIKHLQYIFLIMRVWFLGKCTLSVIIIFWYNARSSAHFEWVYFLSIILDLLNLWLMLMLLIIIVVNIITLVLLPVFHICQL